MKEITADPETELRHARAAIWLVAQMGGENVKLAMQYIGWFAPQNDKLSRVVTKMEQLGFKPTRKNIGTKPLHKTDVSAMMNKFAALLATSGKSWAYADGMARHMFGKEQVNQLDAMSLRKLIAALNIHILKEQAKQAATL